MTDIKRKKGIDYVGICVNYIYHDGKWMKMDAGIFALKFKTRDSLIQLFLARFD